MGKELYQVVAYIALRNNDGSPMINVPLYVKFTELNKKRYDGIAGKRYAPNIGNDDKAERKAIKRLFCERKEIGNVRGRQAARASPLKITKAHASVLFCLR